MYFHLHIIFCYTDLEFSDEDMEDLMALYDRLESNGFVDKIIDAMDEREYNNL
jgi:predicted amino acid racemase